MDGRPLRVLLAEDHAVVREGTRSILESDPAIDVCGEAGDGAEAIRLAERLRPDVVLLDLSLPIVNGIEATRRIRAFRDPPAVLLLTAYDDEDYVSAAMQAGAGGYLLKTAHAAEVVAAIRTVARGDVVLHPSVDRKLVSPSSRRGREALSAREIEILRLASNGQRTKEIAASMGLSTRAVEASLTGIYNRLGVSSRTEAILHAAARGWLPLERPEDVR